MTDAGGDAVLRAAPDAETVALEDGGSMIVDLKSGHCWRLNRVGTEVWTCFQKGDSPSKIVEALLSRYDIGRATIEADVDKVVRDLTGHGLLMPVVPAGP